VVVQLWLPWHPRGKQYFVRTVFLFALCCNLFFVFRIFIHYYLHRRAVLKKLTGNIQSTAKKAAENLSSAAAPILNLSANAEYAANPPLEKVTPI